ncbi:hypothetical protein B0J13DRAFT_106303 [Dactylonectria estremocensis]|uniref:Uncharacterized protein n=1 Tax=Dactylonectria estremocensis TaxID=1079267 RepID=A0A9P9E503_9HYPO|nr:hypothetical protein B0J13DRAFT_106303 [Dactylonectria estremocensis]
MTTPPTPANVSTTILPTAQPQAPKPTTTYRLWTRLRDFLSKNHQPHDFTTDAFVAHDLGVADPFPVLQIAFPVKFPRLVVLLRLFIFLLLAISLPGLTYYFYAFLLSLLPTMLLTAKWLQYKYDIGNGSIKWVWSKVTVLAKVCVLHYFSMTSRGTRIDNVFGKFSCWSFWTTYLIFHIRPARFMKNYLAAWKQQYPYEVAVFFDNKHESFLRIPCRPPQVAGADSLDDEHLLRHLHHIYNIYRIQEGVIAALTPKSLVRVDVIELNHNRFAGPFESTLDLGFDGYQQVARLEHLDTMADQRYLVQHLQDKNVMWTSNPPGGGSSPGTPPDIPPQRALNFVTGWDANAASYIILTPTVLSIFVTVIWPAVAVRKYGADVQSSVQTGTAVASYIITAGALLIALAAWYDSILTTRR